ncbi:MAG: molybdopterin synthase sulfur carrier subunit [Desulfuromonadales bacterium C00003068]|jgi:molybdopterin converting factor small subunit|nr:MoaD/ThiS family protein [Deltaproteobacteria bacterium]OEU75239.1 MAG: molybdopterin synthase sulfur carrier subunit [Desulfuromonadales bacterium C00003068]
MKVTIKLFAQFRNERFKIEQRELPDAMTCLDIVATLAIAESEIGVVMINSRHVPLTQTLNEGDVLALFPLVGGG